MIHRMVLRPGIRLAVTPPATPSLAEFGPLGVRKAELIGEFREATGFKP